MKRLHLSLTWEMLEQAGKAVLAVAGTTVLMLLIGRDRLGEAVVALLYVVPIGWGASHWGNVGGMSAAVAAALSFNFLFIPPFYTFSIGSLEGYLVWAIFMAVALVVVGRIQAALSRARASEREAIFMYELSAALAGMRTQEAVAYTLARQLRQLFQAGRVQVVVQTANGGSGLAAAEPREPKPEGEPDRVLPIWNGWGFAGEIQIWRGGLELPPVESRLLQNFASQAGQALERTRLAEAEGSFHGVTRTVTTVN
jgi:K+-sensing histidine kinase KdpD